jgi:hypothetical protein
MDIIVARYWDMFGEKLELFDKGGQKVKMGAIMKTINCVVASPAGGNQCIYSLGILQLFFHPSMMYVNNLNLEPERSKTKDTRQYVDCK